MKITKATETRFEVVTATVLADGTLRSDSHMELVGNVLKSAERRGFIRTGGLLRVTPGPVSLAKIAALEVGQSVDVF